MGSSPAAAASAPASREGDWTCDGCSNRNYAFRSFCNRCKLPRLLVDSKTPSDSKWLPRIGDWICAGCSNNNYASRDKCKKCGRDKELAALPAMALPGAAMAVPATGLGLGGMMSQHGQTDWSALTGLPGGASFPGAAALTGNWRSGDWLCICGYHNYSSRTTCKQCHSPMPIPPSLPSGLSSGLPSGFPSCFPSGLPSGLPSALALTLPSGLPSHLESGPHSLVQASVHAGVSLKRPAPVDDMGADYANKRYNMGNTADIASIYQNQHISYTGLTNLGNPLVYSSGASAPPPVNWAMQQVAPQQPPPLNLVPAIVGKGAKQWRSGDWMCANCNNHNFASRSSCNRCGSSRDVTTQVLPVN